MKKTDYLNVVDTLIDITRNNHQATKEFNDTLIDYFNLVKQGINQGKNIKEINREINGF